MKSICVQSVFKLPSRSKRIGLVLSQTDGNKLVIESASSRLTCPPIQIILLLKLCSLSLHASCPRATTHQTARQHAANSYAKSSFCLRSQAEIKWPRFWTTSQRPTGTRLLLFSSTFLLQRTSTCGFGDGCSLLFNLSIFAFFSVRNLLQSTRFGRAAPRFPNRLLQIDFILIKHAFSVIFPMR